MLRSSTALILACVLLLCSVATVEPLTIYRIGGEAQSPPSLVHSFEFVQLPWDALDKRRYGQSELIGIRSDYIAPQRLDPSINIVPDLVQRGGGVRRLTWRTWQSVDFPMQSLTDRDATTARIAGSPWFTFGNVFNYADEQTMRPSLVWNFDLGGAFSVHRIRFYPRSEFSFARPVQNFIVGLGGETPLPDRPADYSLGPCPMCKDDPQVLSFEVVHRNLENAQAVVDLSLRPRITRNVLFQAFPNTRGNWEIAEFEIYADGYTARAEYTSNIIDLETPMVFGDISWSGEQPAGTRIALRVRTGDDPDPNTYWRYTFRGDETTRFDQNGRSLDQDSYADLALGEKAGITYDKAHWTAWSPRFVLQSKQTRVPINTLHRFIQIEAVLHSIPQVAPKLGYIQFSASAPIAERLVGNIMPTAVEAGAISQFTYTIKPTIVSAEQGFNRLSIQTPGQVLEVESVRLGGQSVDFTLMHLDANRFEIAFPRIDRRFTEEQLEVDFSARIFRFGTSFAGRVADSTQPYNIPQPIKFGDANPLSDTQSLKVDLLMVHSAALHSLEVSPSVFPPNGDGINDVVQLNYTLVNLAALTPVAFNVYDLSGRRMCSIENTVNTSGQFTTLWDGRTVYGDYLSPGVYILELSVQTDQGTYRRHRLLSVVY